jgi:hypothetical protein
MEIRILSTGVGGIGLAGFSDQLALVINEDGAHIGSATV